MVYNVYVSEVEKMVLWFSGTGNSKYVAQRIAHAFNQEIISIFDRIKNEDYTAVHSDDELIFVVPTYSWRIPRVVEKWIENTQFSGNNSAYFVMTCGGDIGNSEKYIKKLCDKKGFEYMGVMPIVMPENYIAMFDAPDENEAVKIVNKAQPYINSTLQYIGEHKPIRENKVGIAEKLKSSIVNDVFYALFVKDKKFYVTQSCVGCGKCVELCPLNNITMVDSVPKWNGNCTHCMSCICKCPNMAIEYGSKSLNQPRYNCPSNT